MVEHLDIVNAAVSLLIRASLLAARFSGRVRRRSLKRLAAMDTDAKAKEILFLKDRVIDGLERAIQGHGAPKHIISDQAKVFVGVAFAALMQQWNIKPRFGAVGKRESIAVTERVIKTLEYEWLRCVPIVKGFDHLASLCTECESWYNGWRPHMTPEGLRPDDLYYNRRHEKPKRDAKAVPDNIQRHVFAETRLTAYRLENAA